MSKRRESEVAALTMGAVGEEQLEEDEEALLKRGRGAERGVGGKDMLQN